jgi:secreted PhoX family phosphatase
VPTRSTIPCRITSRRRTLQLLAGVPMLPLAAPSNAGNAPAAPAATVTHARFTPMAAPTLADPAAMASMSVRSALEVELADGSRLAWPLAYRTLFVTGERLPDGRGGEVVAGGCVDIDNRPIVDRSLAGRERQFYSDCPDGMTLLKLDRPAVAGVRGNAVFAVVQFEYVSRDAGGRRLDAPLPSPIAVLTLDQDPASGHLRLVQYRNVDSAPAHGLWTTCGASLSPWNTHLSSEEFAPDATTAAGSAWFRGFSRNLYGDPARANPYRYGHVPEVTVHADGSGSVRKHYCMGRISHEVVRVMPDERTVLMGDDWDNGGLFMFIADRPRELAAGTLYVAKWEQTSGKGPGAARLSWIRLGAATSAEIEALIDGGIEAARIIDVRTRAPDEPGFTRIPYAGRANWVRLKPGMDKAAAFLETHRYAALRGGSLGFTKMEGTAVDARDRVAYVAISRIERPMTDGSGGIRVEGPYSGAVYALNLRGRQHDSDGRAIDSDWVPVDMAAVPALVAEDFGGAPHRRQDALGNTADPERLATPDNLCFSAALRTLFIGEDSDTHVNNFLWAYHVDRRELVRILSCPVGAESTGLHAVDEINGWTYIASNFQHAGDWKRGLHDKVRDTLEPLVRANYRDRSGAAVGYLTAATGGIRLHRP